MNKLDRIMIGAKIKAGRAFATMREKSLSKEHGDETLIVKVMLMVIAVALCVVFRDTISTVIENLIKSVEDKISSILNPQS